jgi:methionine-rich copper-binding protein CopC
MRFRALAGLALVAAALAAATPAQAHNYLVSSTPAEDSTLTTLPEVFSVTTNEAMLDLSGDGAGFAIQVLDSADRYYGDGCFAIVDSTLSMGATLGEAGDYTVLWQIVSEDGHPVSGEFGFTWTPPAGFAATPGLATPPDCGGTAPQASAAAPTAPATHSDASLSDVLWIGGAIGAVVIAALVAFLVLGRRRKA